MKAEPIGVVGAGSWGTALAWVLGQQGQPVYLWGRNRALIQQMAHERVNRRYLPEAILPDSITPIAELDALSACPLLVLAVPSAAIREVASQLPQSGRYWVIAAKGLEPGTGKRLSEVVQESAGLPLERLVVLSGPNLAVEMVRGIPTATVAASVNPDAAAEVQQLFMTPSLRVYTNHDIIGVELGGALKNVYAIGAGISDGLGFGDNTKGALLTRGLAEMRRLGVACGAQPETFMGLTGVGDLFATAASKLSRNYRLGYAIAQGVAPADALRQLGQVAEGYPTALVAEQLACQHQVEMPLLSAIANLLRGLCGVRDALQSLMTRPPKGEHE